MDIDPATANSQEDLVELMRLLRLHADNPSYRELEQRASRGKKASLSRTTLGEVLGGRRFPSKAFLLTFVQVCGVDSEEEERWEATWKRLAPQYLIESRSPEFSQDPESPADPAGSELEIQQIRDGLAEMAARLDKVNEENFDLAVRVSVLTSRIKNLVNRGNASYSQGDVRLTHELPYIPSAGTVDDVFAKIEVGYSWYCSRCKVGGDSPEVNYCPWCADIAVGRIVAYNVRIPSGVKEGQKICLKGIGMCSSEGRGPGVVYLTLLQEPPF
ncbi:hypothetical protein AB0I90_31670 [Micromonospora wenchangensis]|uniref:hypothetical protein n=1 Tax=Micromonospora wenchangensis TaxID=1185415 RepID=UPI0033F32E5F